MIAAWLTNKALTIVLVICAILGVIMTPVAAIQTVRLDGVSLFGWHLIDGALHGRDVANAARDRALSDLHTCHDNTKGLQASIDAQNAEILKMGADSDAATKRAADALAKAMAGRSAAKDALARIAAAMPGADACKSADALILETVK